jgi:hypothetical protein
MGGVGMTYRDLRLQELVEAKDGLVALVVALRLVGRLGESLHDGERLAQVGVVDVRRWRVGNQRIEEQDIARDPLHWLLQKSSLVQHIIYIFIYWYNVRELMSKDM